MKNLFIIFGLLLYSISAHSQDLIVLRSGEEIESKVQEVATDVIKYKKLDNLTGPTYSIEKNKVFMIKYENGSKDVFEQTESTSSISESKNETGPIPAKSFNINPLGLLQFGPIFQYEGKISDNAVIVPYFRYAYLGLAMHALSTEFEEGNELSPATFGLGLGVKGFTETTGNSLYYGGFADFNVGKINYDVGELSETEEKFTGLALVSNIGYRWRKPSGSNVNLGIFAGANFAISDEEVYVSNGELYAEYDETTFFAMIELSFGW